MTDLRIAYQIQEFDSFEGMYLLDDNKRKLYETAEKIKKKEIWTNILKIYKMLAPDINNIQSKH